MVSHSLPQSVVNQKRAATPEGMAYCRRCDQYKEISKFSIDRASPNGLCTYCKDCQSAWRNTPEGKAKQAAYDATPERKTKKATYEKDPRRKANRSKNKQNPEYKERQKEYRSRPEIKARIAKRAVAYLASPEGRAKRKEYVNSPKQKAKRVISSAIYRAKPETKRRNSAYKKMIRHNLTQEGYNALFAAQNGVCAICKKPEVAVRRGKVLPLHIDHDHATGEVRGLLCFSCNVGLGMFKDNLNNLYSAVNYMEKFHK